MQLKRVVPGFRALKAEDGPSALYPGTTVPSIEEESGGIRIKVCVVLRRVVLCRVFLLVIVHQEQFGNDVPRDVGVEVGVAVEKLHHDVAVDQGVEGAELLAQPHVGPHGYHVGVTVQNAVPHLKYCIQSLRYSEITNKQATSFPFLNPIRFYFQVESEGE